MRDALLSDFSDDERDELQTNIEALAGGYADFEELWNTYDEDKRERYMGAYTQVLVELPETTLDLVSEWWVDTIKALLAKDIDGDDLPANIVTIGAVDTYLAHIQDNPFLSGQ